MLLLTSGFPEVDSQITRAGGDLAGRSWALKIQLNGRVECSINCSILADPTVLHSLGAVPTRFRNERQGHHDEQSECSSRIPIQACARSAFSFIEVALVSLPLLFARVEKNSSFSWAADLMVEGFEEGPGSSV